MPTPRQIREIKDHLRQIKQVQKNGGSEQEIESAAQDFYQYLANEGLIDLDD